MVVAGPGLSELLRPDVVRPLLESLQLEERLAPYLPEVFVLSNLMSFSVWAYVVCVWFFSMICYTLYITCTNCSD